jgi:high frequency lysogenization protein
MLKTIFTGIERARAQSEHFGLLHENVLANLGDIYHSTISTLQPRIMVNGEQEYLSSPISSIKFDPVCWQESVRLFLSMRRHTLKFYFSAKIQAELQNLMQQL